jgi:hypothetical protein
MCSSGYQRRARLGESNFVNSPKILALGPIACLPLEAVEIAGILTLALAITMSFVLLRPAQREQRVLGSSHER